MEKQKQHKECPCKYDRDGKLLWEKRFAADDGSTSLRGFESAVVDAQGNLYLSEWRQDNQLPYPSTQFTKLTASGEVEWQWFDPAITDSLLTSDLRLGVDGNLYASLFHYGAISLTPTGEFRWLKFPYTGSSISDDATTLDDFTQTTVKFSAAPNTQYVVVMTPETLNVLGLDGIEIATFSAVEFDFSFIQSVEINGDQIVVLGTNTANQVRATYVKKTEGGFVHDASTDVTLSENANFALLAARADGGFCFALSEENTRIVTGSINQDLDLQWKKVHTIDAASPYPAELSKIKSDGNYCYSQYVESHAVDRITSVVLIEHQDTAKEKAKLEVDHFFASDFAIQGDYVYQSGITGSYTENEGTAATLIKHRVY